MPGPDGNRQMTGFITRERAAQGDYFAKHLPAEVSGFLGSSYRLLPEQRALNLAPSIREDAPAYFAQHGIAWHLHANHGLSSQVSCLNFLMPLATRPELLARLIGDALGLPPPAMLEVESGPDGRPWFVAFEWIGYKNYLNEAVGLRPRTRGANATSADAMVRFKHEGRTETVLIEWKYTEHYGAPIAPGGNGVRQGRYQGLAFAPVGPVRADCGLVLGDFFWEPFYQMLRQQMLAFQMQAANEGGAERVRVLSLSPAGNRALHTVTAPALRCHGDDAFDVFRGLLTRPEDFVSCSIGAAFGKVLSDPGLEGQSWADYLLGRYTFMRSP